LKPSEVAVCCALLASTRHTCWQNTLAARPSIKMSANFTPAPSVEGSIDMEQERPLEAISAISHSPDEMVNTLDEPVVTTIMRDLRIIGRKLKVVLLPGGTLRESLPSLPGTGGANEATMTAQAEATLKALRDWDLFGPLLLCLVFSIVLSLSAPSQQTSLVFAGVFVTFFVGAAIVTTNAKLLGGKISFFQSVSLLGYSTAPLVIAALFCYLVSNTLLRTLVVGLALVWATRGKFKALTHPPLGHKLTRRTLSSSPFLLLLAASVVFMAGLVDASKRQLAVYPVVLYFLVLSWMAAIQ
jgi:protein YIPF6